jgi:hypothetical protein
VTTERLSLAERLDRAGLLPHQREAAGVSLVLCELIDELIMATDRQTVALHAQTALLEQRLERRADNRNGQTRSAGKTAGAAAPSGPAEGDDQGGADVQLREPGLPPADPNPEPAAPDGADRPVAEPPAETAPASRRAAAKTTATKKTAAKTPTATREGRKQ